MDAIRKKNWIIVLACCFVVSIIDIFIIHGSFIMQSQNVHSSAMFAFTEALTIDKNKQLKEVPVSYHYDPKKSSIQISFEEKENWIWQSYITTIDTNRISLDSIFQKKLCEHHLPLKSAVSISYQSEMHYSCPNKAFYHKAFALAPVIYRKDYDAKNNIELRGYIQLSSWFILLRMQIFYIIIICWILSITAIISGFLLWNKRKQKKLQEKHTALKAKIVEWTVLPNGVSFDRITGMLKYEDRTTQLIRNQLKLFCLFLDSSNHFVSYKTINSIVLKRKTETDLTNSDRNAIYGTISRLKISFEGFPPFRIITVDQKGYRLEFNDENSDYQH